MILLEIEPEKQKTRIDFACTKSLSRRMASLPNENQKARPADCSTNAMVAKCRIERIYNRVIFDELLRRPDVMPGFNFQR